MSKKNPTMNDVARAAGVNASTVSRVMNPETRGMVSDEVAKRILLEAKKLGYRPNRAASTLRTRRSKVVGVVLPDITNAVFPPILMGLEEGLRQHGYLAIVVNVGTDEEEQRFVLNRLLGQQVDGLVFATAKRTDPLVLECAHRGTPVVTVNRSEESGQVSCIVSDEAHGMRLAVSHMAEWGHRRLAHIAGPDDLSTGHSRRLGFQNAVRALGLDPDQCVVLPSTGYTREAGKTALLKLLAQHPDVTGVIAGNDLVALGCYDALKALGLSCPGHLSIIGHNDMPLMDMVDPPLTTVRIQHHDLGLEAARLLLHAIESPAAPVVEVALKSVLVTRQSCAEPRSADPAQ